MAKTYVVGNLNSVIRLDNHTAPWVTVSPPDPTYVTVWRDVMTDPINSSKVFVVGTAEDTTLNNLSIQVSSDAGLTWVTPTGTWAAATSYLYEIWCVDTNIIWATGKDGIVVLSTDGGLTFNVVPTLVGGGTYLQTAGIFALSNLIAVVLGSPGEGITQSSLYVWKTIDGGTTWTMLSGASLPAPSGGGIDDIGNANGIWMSSDQQKIVVGSGYNQYLSINGGTTWNSVGDDFYRSGYHLTWFPAYSTDPQFFRHFGGPYEQVNESVDSGLTFTKIRSSIIPFTDPAITIKGAHFYTPYNGYYTVGYNVFATADGADTGVVSYANPNTLLTYEAVWTSVEVPPFALCYELVDCEGILQSIYTQTDLSEHVGQVITLADSTNHEIPGCWFVNATDLSCPDSTIVKVYKCYADCVTCVPAPIIPPIPTPRPVNPGYDTGSCDSDIVEKAKCDFVNMMYQQMMSIRYAIKFCCPPNVMAVVSQKEKIEMLLNTGVNPTPDPCNPKCVAYEMFIDPTDEAETTYMDCLGVTQILITPQNRGGVNPKTIIEFCGYDTVPPVCVVTHADLTTDTYILEVVDVC